MITEERYKEIIQFLLAIEEADNVCEEIIDRLDYVVPFDAAIYLEIGPGGMLDGYYSKVNITSKRSAVFNDRFFAFQDPVFDYGNRASGRLRVEAEVYDTSAFRNNQERIYHSTLQKAGIISYLSFTIGPTGEGIRLYRASGSVPFSDEDREVCRHLGIILSRVVPRLRNDQNRQKHNKQVIQVQKMLPFGLMVLDQNLKLIMYNALATTRVSDLTGEYNIDLMFDRFLPTIKELLETAVQSGREAVHTHLNNRYILELIIQNDVNEKGLHETFYTVCLYSSDWFRTCLTVSNETVFEEMQLTPREKEIAEQIAIGNSAQEVADELHISVYTVKEHIKSIYRKSGVKTRAEFISTVYTAH